MVKARGWDIYLASPKLSECKSFIYYIDDTQDKLQHQNWVRRTKPLIWGFILSKYYCQNFIQPWIWNHSTFTKCSFSMVNTKDTSMMILRQNIEYVLFRKWINTKQSSNNFTKYYLQIKIGIFKATRKAWLMPINKGYTKGVTYALVILRIQLNKETIHT